MDPLVAAALSLFPTSDHQEFAGSAYGYQAVPTSVYGQPADFTSPEGVDLMYRRVFDTERALRGETSRGTGETMRLRFYRDANGQLQLDELSMESLLLSVHSRPLMGERLNVGLLMGSWDEVWWFGDTGRSQWRVYSPVELTLLGFANNDMDEDERLKYYFSGGLGLGGDAMLRVLGPIGVQVRADAKASTMNRNKRDAPNPIRHELELDGELGVAWIGKRQAVVLGGWMSQVTQWDPRDAQGRDGVDRDYLAAGVRLSARIYKEKEVEVDEPDLDALMDVIRKQVPQPGDEDRPRLFERREAPSDGQGEAEPEPEGPQYQLLEVHWSELERTQGEDIAMPEGLEPGTVCTVRVFIDPTGVPYDVQPETCPVELQDVVVGAVGQWRFVPVIEDGDTVSVQAVFPVGVGG